MTRPVCTDHCTLTGGAGRLGTLQPVREGAVHRPPAAMLWTPTIALLSTAMNLTLPGNVTVPAGQPLDGAVGGVPGGTSGAPGGALGEEEPSGTDKSSPERARTLKSMDTLDIPTIRINSSPHAGSRNRLGHLMTN